MDDIYHKLVFDGRQAVSAWRFTDRDVESTKVVLVNGVAKTYGMTGFRIGWAVASRELVAVMTNIQSQTTTCSSTVLQAGAEGALNGDQGVVETLRRAMQENRDLVMQGLASIPGVRCAKPDGTFYCLPDFSAHRRRLDAALGVPARAGAAWSPCPAGSSAWRGTCGSPTPARGRTWWRPSRA